MEVVEHAGDYEQAVAAGRAQAASDPFCHSTSASRSLLQGCSASAPRCSGNWRQRHHRGRHAPGCSSTRSCGVGGAPAGILSACASQAACALFAEPVQSPCFWCRCWLRTTTPASVRLGARAIQTRPTAWPCRAPSLLVASLMHQTAALASTPLQDATLFQHLALGASTPRAAHRPSAAPVPLARPCSLAPEWTRLAARAGTGGAHLARHAPDLDHWRAVRCPTANTPIAFATRARSHTRVTAATGAPPMEPLDFVIIGAVASPAPAWVW